MRDGLGRFQSVLLLGGRSEIGGAIARGLVAEGTERVVLAARASEQLAPEAAELRALGATSVELLEFDACELPSHETVIARAFAAGDVDLVVLAFGLLGPERDRQRDRSEALAVTTTNYLGAVSVLLAVADRMVAQGHGTIVVLSSVAGERARAANFVYGASKAGLDAFAQGLGDELAKDGVDVLVVRPGFVRTKMTAGRAVAPFATSADAVARATLAGLRRRAHTVWAPAVLHPVMLTLRALPRPVFRRIPS